MSILQISHVKCDQKSKLLIVKTFTLAFNSSYNYLLLKKRKKKIRNFTNKNWKRVLWTQSACDTTEL